MFYILAGLVVVSLVTIVSARKIMVAALGFLGCLLSLAGIYAWLNHELLAVVQIMVYAGGVLVVFLFGIMVTGRTRTGETIPIRGKNRVLAFFVSVGFAALLGSVSLLLPRTAPAPAYSMREQSTLLFTDYALAFELAGLLLLAALIAGATLASTRPRT